MRQKREEIQRRALSDLYYDDPRIVAAEIRTGTGKTKILLDLAKKHTAQGRNVIISTANNFLARSFFDEADKFDHDTDRMHLLIGRSNYIDEEIALSGAFLDFYGLRKSDVVNWINENKGMLIVDLFIHDFGLPEEVKEEVVLSDTEQRTLTEAIEKIITHKKRGKVFVTNHHYLIYLLQYAKKNEIQIGNDTVFMFDEAHTIDDAARSVFSSRFSLNYMRIGLRQLLAVEESKTTKAMRKRITKLLVGIDMLIAQIRAGALGKTTAGTPRTVADAVKSFIQSDEVGKVVKWAKNKAGGKAGIFLGEYHDASSIFLAKEITPTMIELSFSAIRQYPSFLLETGNRTYRLRSAISHPNSPMVFVSGTLRVSKEEDVASNQWSFIKMGLLPYTGDTTELSDISVKARELFNRRVETMVFKCYPHIFKREDVRFICAKSDKLSPPSVKIGNTSTKSVSSTIAYEKWISGLSEYLSERIVKNCVCLMTSFENAELMAEALIERIGGEYSIVLHSKGRTVAQTVNQYKELIDNGKSAVLVGALPFFTGIDLHGKYLTTLFIGKLPIEPKPTLLRRSGKGLPSIHTDIKNKALITFRQGIGRAKRKEEDKVFVIVADPRINSRRYGNMRVFLEEMGVEVKEE